MATYLLVEVDDAEATQVEAFIGSIGGVTAVGVHNEGPGWGCCCKNCPWNRNHG
jgi:hypothetical protein